MELPISLVPLTDAAKLQWGEPAYSWAIMNRWPSDVPPPMLSEPSPVAMLTWAKSCHWRVLNLRNALRSEWEGLGPEEMHELGYVLDWLVASLIARENVLLLGGPGVAKTEIALRTFQILGLSQAEPNDALLKDSLESAESPRTWWLEREKEERKHQKYFHYLLSRFSQLEELFGPVEISLLRKGILVRVNFGLLTGPGVRAAFLDEIFKASSSILNALLTLSLERRYFNWGGMVFSDLSMLIGASNEMPGGFAARTGGISGRDEDFQTLYAFLDRFPVRLEIPVASGSGTEDVSESNLAKAFTCAMNRECDAFSYGKHFLDPAQVTTGPKTIDPPNINDILFLGRCCFPSRHIADPVRIFSSDNLARFKNAFLHVARALQTDGTSVADGRITWTVSPRKLKALYKIALAHALVTADNFPSSGIVNGPGKNDLHVFDLMWDSAIARRDLANRVNTAIMEYW